MVPRADRGWDPHTSYHVDGTFHAKSHGRKFGPPLNNQTSGRKTAPYSLNTNIESLGNAAHGRSPGLVSLTDSVFDLGGMAGRPIGFPLLVPLALARFMPAAISAL
jgi:hypothetical protein